MIDRWHCQFVTRGNVDMSPILESLDLYVKNYSLSIYVWDYSTSVWDNSKRFDLKVFGRYVGLYPGLGYADHVIYTQDDDCVLNPTDLSKIVLAYTPGVVVCNVPAHRRPEYSDGIALVGWGAIFDRNLTGALNLYLKHYPLDDLFLTECDRIFTGLNRVKLIDVPFTHLPHATSPITLHQRTDHWDKLREVRNRIYRVKMLERLVGKVGLE